MSQSPETISLKIKSSEEIIPKFKEALDQISQKAKLSSQLIQDLSLAFTEALANAIRHAEELKKRPSVDVRLKIKEDHIQIEVDDHGSGFNLSKVPLPQFKSYAESGRGIFMMRQLMDSVSYKRHKKKNTLILKRSLMGADKTSKDLDLLYEISDAIVQSSSIESIYSIILDRLVDLFAVERASILIYDSKIKRLKVVASRGLGEGIKAKTEVKPGEGISGYVFRHAKACLIEDMDRNNSGWKKKKKYKSRSFISAPMISLGGQNVESLGVINLTDRLDGKSFTKKDLKLLTTIANQATAYLHTCHLMSQVREAEMLRKEMDLARQIQQNYLPLKPPSIPGLDIGGFLETAQSVGGDYYDFIIKKNKLYIVLADVSGHHFGSALTMANFRSQLKAFLMSESSVSKILSMLNRSLYDDLIRHDQFISMLLMSLDLKTKKMTFSSAGHRCPILIDKKLEDLSDSKKISAVLGALQEEEFKENKVLLHRKQRVVLFTDGLPEASNESGKRFSIERVYDALSQSARLDSKTFLKDLKSKINRFQKKAPLTDDISVVTFSFLY